MRAPAHRASRSADNPLHRCFFLFLLLKSSHSFVADGTIGTGNERVTARFDVFYSDSPVDLQSTVSFALNSTRCTANGEGTQFSLSRSWSDATSESSLSNKEALSDDFLITDERAAKNGCFLFRLSQLC